jgi:DegV family protein with EDD domain
MNRKAIDIPIITELDGRNLYYTFIAGAEKMLVHQAEINRINVFPVNDQDTGTNLASTLRSVIENIKPNRSYHATANNIAEAALIGARGNSGVIFAQFLYGLSVETSTKPKISIPEFAESVKNAVRHIYDAVAKPVEGTMLTVIRDWADYIHDNKDKFTDFNKLFPASLETLKVSLLKTKDQLEVLKKANVVDAGAKGFVVFVEGIIEFIRHSDVRKLKTETLENDTIIHSEDITKEEITHRYCTEAIIKNPNLDKDDMKAFLEQHGNSVVVAGSGKMNRIHLHTNDPAAFFSEALKVGTIPFQKIDDMQRQQEVAYKRKWNIALVTDSTCDLPAELIEKYQIHMLPINLNFGENHYLDRVSIQPEQFYTMLAESPDFPKTSQINERAFTNLYSHLASHYDAIISVHLSNELSGTYSSSMKAAKRIKDEFGKPVHVVDSKSLSGSLGLIVMQIARAIERDEKIDAIMKQAEQWVNNTGVFVSAKTLKYFIKGGRVSPLKGYISRLLNIIPIISVTPEGKSFLFGKAFSQKSNMKKVILHIEKLHKENEVLEYIVMHAQNAAAAGWFSEKMEGLTGIAPLSIVNISPAIGINAGPGTVGVSIIQK